MIVFIVSINDHNTAFYTWHDFSSEKHVSYYCNMFFGTKINMECSIVIIDEYYENSHYYATMQMCEMIW